VNDPHCSDCQRNRADLAETRVELMRVREMLERANYDIAVRNSQVRIARRVDL